MKVGLVTICYNEERFIKPFLQHIPDWVDKKIVLVSTQPWQGEPELSDNTDVIAKDMGATVVMNYWPTEEEQRNTGQMLCEDCDWIIILDPDEFLSDIGWAKLYKLMESGLDSAYVCSRQRVFYKKMEVAPHTDYQQIILVKPNVKFIENRVVNTSYNIAPLILYHFSWARTNEEVKSKLSHYSHADEFDWLTWYNEVWLDDTRVTDLHPKTPETLKALIMPRLPKEIKDLNLWPR